MSSHSVPFVLPLPPPLDPFSPLPSHPLQGDEQMSLRDLDFVAKQLKMVLLRVVEMESTTNVKSKYPLLPWQSIIAPYSLLHIEVIATVTLP